MPHSRLLFHRLAAKEYRLARQWYRERSLDVADRFVAAVDKAAERIVSDADALPALLGEYRYWPVSRFPYVLVFRRLESDLVMVVAVAHTSRKPNYWRRRK